MNIQKSRFAATLTVMLMVCMMVTLLVVPASAAEMTSYDFYAHETNVYDAAFAAFLGLGSTIESPGVVTSFNIENRDTIVYANADRTCFLIREADLRSWIDIHNEKMENPVSYDFTQGYYISPEGDKYYPLSRYVYSFEMTDPVKFTFHDNDNTSLNPGLSSVVTQELLSGGLDEVVALLPVVIPVMIGFIGLRKGISFLQSVLHSA